MAAPGLRGRIESLRSDASAAHIAPLAAFLLLMLLMQEPVLIDNSLQPWYRHAPEHWVYPLQCVVAGLMLWFFRHAYRFRPFQGFGFATLCGLVGIAFWIAPAELYRRWEWEPGNPLRFFGFQDRSEGGFDPTFFRDHAALYFAAIAMRLVRMVVIVPFVEEIFWRGFLMRYLYDRDRDFQAVPFGSFSWFSLLGTAVAFMLVHQPADYAAALLYGLLAGWVAIRTKSLMACVWMHALANLILGIYVLWSGQRGFW